MANQRKRPVAVSLDAKQIGARIRQTRKAYGWNLYDLSRVTGIPRGTLASYECGSRVAIVHNQVAIALALRRTVDFLLLGKRDPRRGA